MLRSPSRGLRTVEVASGGGAVASCCLAVPWARLLSWEHVREKRSSSAARLITRGGGGGGGHRTRRRRGGGDAGETFSAAGRHGGGKLVLRLAEGQRQPQTSALVLTYRSDHAAEICCLLDACRPSPLERALLDRSRGAAEADTAADAAERVAAPAPAPTTMRRRNANSSDDNRVELPPPLVSSTRLASLEQPMGRPRPQPHSDRIGSAGPPGLAAATGSARTADDGLGAPPPLAGPGGIVYV